MNGSVDDTEPFATAIAEAAIAAGLGPGTTVTGLKRLSGGASKESWAFDLVAPGGEVTQAVLRRQPAELRFSLSMAGGLATEAAVLRAAGGAGVPVPGVLFVLPEGSAVGEGYAMTRIAGETVGTRILKDPSLAEARKHLAFQCGEILARIHSVQLDALPELPSASPAEALAAIEDRYRATGQDRPVFEYALRWLAANLPVDGARALVHGDFRNGNLVVGPQGVRAVLDWELASIGAPVSDLGWLCVNSWRFQRPENPAGGFGSYEDLLAGYRAGGGGEVDRAELHAWEVFQTLNWGVMCAEVGKTYMEGTRTVEGAMIAHRASETEFDLLRLLMPDEGAWHA